MHLLFYSGPLMVLTYLLKREARVNHELLLHHAERCSFFFASLSNLLAGQEKQVWYIFLAEVRATSIQLAPLATLHVLCSIPGQSHIACTQVLQVRTRLVGT